MRLHATKFRETREDQTSFDRKAKRPNIFPTGAALDEPARPSFWEGFVFYALVPVLAIYRGIRWVVSKVLFPAHR